MDEKDAAKRIGKLPREKQEALERMVVLCLDAIERGGGVVAVIQCEGNSVFTLMNMDRSAAAHALTAAAEAMTEITTGTAPPLGARH